MAPNAYTLEIRSPAMRNAVTAWLMLGLAALVIEEGYGRGFGKQLINFYTVALGSARETEGRYYRARYLLNEGILQERLQLCQRSNSSIANRN